MQKLVERLQQFALRKINSVRVKYYVKMGKMQSGAKIHKEYRKIVVRNSGSSDSVSTLMELD